MTTNNMNEVKSKLIDLFLNVKLRKNINVYNRFVIIHLIKYRLTM